MTIRSYHEREAMRLYAKAAEFDEAAMQCDSHLFHYFSKHAVQCERLARGHEARIEELDK